jgi:pimeloyl-ACP methyl ester carboxylesterase
VLGEIPEFVSRGHEAVAIDCPGHGKRVDEDACGADYRDAVVDVIQPGDIVVDHSMGGFTTTLAVDAAIDRVSHAVYLAAGLPIEGQPMNAAGAGASHNADRLSRPPTMVSG